MLNMPGKVQSHSARLRAKIRNAALAVRSPEPTSESVEEFCRRLNRLKAKSDDELKSIGLERRDIGAYVLDGLLQPPSLVLV